jgi:hypothetical protein
LQTGGIVGQDEVKVGDVHMRFVPVDQRDPIGGHPDIARIIVAVDDACLVANKSRPRRPAPSNSVWRHRAKVEPRSGFGVQEVSRGSPTWALRPAWRQAMQLTQCLGDAVPVALRLGRPALYVFDYHQAVGERAAIYRQDRHRHAETFTVKVSQQISLPREISVAPGTQAADCKSPMDAHAPGIIGNSAREPFKANCVFAPLQECFPSHWHMSLVTFC